MSNIRYIIVKVALINTPHDTYRETITIGTTISDTWSGCVV